MWYFSRVSLTTKVHKESYILILPWENFVVRKEVAIWISILAIASSSCIKLWDIVRIWEIELQYSVGCTVKYLLNYM